MSEDANESLAARTERMGGDPPLSLHSPRPAVTRVSRRAVLMAGAFGAALGLVILIAGLGDRGDAKRDGAPDEPAIRPSGPVESIRDLPRDYTFDARQAQAIAHDSFPATTRPGPTPQDRALAEQLRQLAELRRQMLQQEQKESADALNSPLVFASAKSTPARSATSAATQPAMPDGLADLRSRFEYQGLTALNGATTASDGPPAGILENHQKEKEEFLSKAAAVEPYLQKPLLDPVSQFELKAGSVIPGALITGINTDLPGEVVAQVPENVYDSVTGDYLLIPQGARLLGKYQSLVTNGQNRALIAWQRLIYPNGQSIVLDGMPGTDEAGQAGLADQVDYHADKLAAATALSTAIAYTGNLARNRQSNSNGYSAGDVIGDSVAQEANRIGQKIIDRELDVQPTITIRPGWPLRVLVNKDMVLSAYQR